MDDELVRSYVAGAFDWGSVFRLRVRKAPAYRIGFTVEPQIDFQKKDEAVMGLLDEFCVEHGIKHNMGEEDRGVYRLSISRRDDVWRFLEAVYQYSVVRHDAIEVMLNEVRPRIKAGEHKNKEGFLELMKYVDEAREGTGRDSVKYDRAFFEQEWDL